MWHTYELYVLITAHENRILRAFFFAYHHDAVVEERLRKMKISSLLVVGVCTVWTMACADSASSVAPSAAFSKLLTAPTVVSPNDQAQLNSLRPTLTVASSPDGATGTRTYEFQVSDRSDFS